MTQVKEVPILIIGGGIGGLSSALALSKLDKEIIVLEQAEEFKEVGAGFQLAPNALSVLDRLGVLEEVYSYSVFPKRNVAKDIVTGRELGSIDLGEPFLKKFGYPYVVMHRADLLNTLLNACKAAGNVTLHTNHRVEKIEDLGDRMQVTCENGKQFIAELLIGADGVRSTARKLIVDDEPCFSEYVAYRGTMPVEEIASQIDINLDEKVTYIGPYMHFVQYPLRSKEIFNQVAVFKSFRYQKGREMENDWGTPDELDERFSIAHPAIRKAATFLHRIRRWPMYDRNPITTWTKGRLALLGDAAHGMVQYLAQGAVQTLEDSAKLADKLQMYGSDYEKALAAYQEERVPRATTVQRWARQMGEITHAADPTTILLRNYIFETKKPDDYSLMDWLYSPQK